MCITYTSKPSFVAFWVFVCVKSLLPDEYIVEWLHVSARLQWVHSGKVTHKQCIHGRVSECWNVSYCSVCELKLEFVLERRPLVHSFYHNITRQLYFEYLLNALHRIHHSKRPGNIWLPVGLSDWLLWSCQADCLSHCMSVGLSDCLPWSCHADCLTPEQTNAARFLWHTIAQWQPLHQFCVTAHESGSANRPVGRYTLM